VVNRGGGRENQNSIKGIPGPYKRFVRRRGDWNEKLGVLPAKSKLSFRGAVGTERVEGEFLRTKWKLPRLSLGRKSAVASNEYPVG